MEITADGVKVEYDSQIETITADTVVMATGSISNNSLNEPLERKGISHDIIGDTNLIAMAYDAVNNGFAVGRNI